MLRSWQLKIELDREVGSAIYLQIAARIVDEIKQGRLPSSTVMPGTRELSESLKVNRKTVVLAYDELIAQGWLVTENRRGTFVSAILPNYSIPSNPHASSQTESPRVQAISKDHLLANEGMIDFSEGMPDTRLIPYEVLSRAFRHALLLTSRSNQMGDDNPQGRLELRQALASMLNMEKGLHVDADNICMVRGSQMGVFIAARILTKPGDCVVFEDLTYETARDAFKSCGAEVKHVAVDQHGMMVDQLENLCQTERVKVVFVTPQHQYPTTVILSKARRKELLRLADLYDFIIVEDDHDHEFQFAKTAAFPLASEDKGNRVVYLGSLSSMLAPGLRIGYLVGTQPLMQRFASDVMLIDTQGNNTLELAISELMNSGEIQRHILRMTKVYNERRSALQKLIHDELGKWVSFDLPHGGLAFWLRFKNKINMQLLKQHALTEKVKFTMGSAYSENNEEVPAIRLGFASLNQKELISGIQRIKRVLLAAE